MLLWFVIEAGALKERPQLLHVVAARSGEERRGDPQTAPFWQIETGARGTDMGSGTTGKLAAGRRFTPNCLSDLLEAGAEHVVEKKGGALERRQRSAVAILAAVAARAAPTPRTAFSTLASLSLPCASNA
jgi:hypothetical protein